MTYTVLTGRFVIRYPDLPRQGPEPDGDTVKFRPDSPALVEGLPRPSGSPPDLTARGISVRLEAIDALETHFAETHQDLGGANAAREELLHLLGFTGVQFFDDHPNKVRASDQDDVRGYVLSNGIDANGRMIGFVQPGESPDPDGGTVFLDDAGIDRSLNSRLLAAGLVYPAFYATLPGSLRTHLAGISRKARADRAGIWAASTADPDGAATVADLAGLQRLTIWPKLFRRLVPYLATGATGLDGLDAWLRSDPVNRDDSLFLLDRLETGNLHDIIEASGQRVRMTMWPEDFIIDPDPAAPGTPTTPPKQATGDVVIVAALPDPAGGDRGRERLTLLNTTAAAVDLTGWTLRDGNGRTQVLAGSLAGGDVLQLVASDGVTLGNTGGTVTLADALGSPIDRVSYRAGQVKEGRTIAFGR
ncbi:lamin tail domain-containing protein [Actinoplanes sp. NPDC051475]|uniref:lamin tail domain-containing protein n=1 Tax=Actinoplanes sp. NPDC051475 TaxID=3157225 RepID=UPI00344D59AD